MKHKKELIFTFLLLLGFSLFIACEKQLVCLNNGKCKGGKCECTEIYSGLHCDVCNCIHGTCNPNGDSCVCPPIYKGTLCQTCKCQNNGTCDNDSLKCDCPPYFTGSLCETDNRPDCMKKQEGALLISNSNLQLQKRGVKIDGGGGHILVPGEAFPKDVSVGRHTVTWHSVINNIIVIEPVICIEFPYVLVCEDIPIDCSQ